MPPVKNKYVLDCLEALGFFEYAGEARVPLSPANIKAWSEMTGWPLSLWQAETLLKASQAFVKVLNDKKCPMPWSDGSDRVALSRSIKAVFRTASTR